MALLKVIKLGNPVLRQQALPIDLSEIKTSVFQQLVDDMFETMYDEPGIGLAAPQVGRSQQLVVMDCPGESGFPATALINPHIAFYGPEQAESWEGCLSVDGLRGSYPSITRPCPGVGSSRGACGFRSDRSMPCASNMSWII